MRRRSLVLALPAGLALLGACTARTTDEQEGAASAEVPADLDAEPVVRGQAAETIDLSTVSLPLEMTTMIVVDPGWTSTPLVRDGILLAYDDAGDRLRFRAVDQDGMVLWEAERPLSCTGFALSQDDDGRAIAVLADLAPREEGMEATTLTGYDLRTAEVLWGPLEAPGPQAAHGMVYAAGTDRPMGEGGSRTALDAATGEPALTEEDLDGGRILAEHGGLVVHTDGADLVALSSHDGEQVWRTPLPEGFDADRARIAPAIDAATDLAVLADDAGPGTALDLADGGVVAQEAEAVAHDHGLDVTVVAGGTLVRGLDPEGEEIWRHEDPEQLVFQTAGERLAYAQRPEEGTLVVLDTSRGLMVHPYDVDLDAPLAVPELFTPDAAAAVRVEENRYLVTTQLDESFGMD